MEPNETQWDPVEPNETQWDPVEPGGAILGLDCALDVLEHYRSRTKGSVGAGSTLVLGSAFHLNFLTCSTNAARSLEFGVGRCVHCTGGRNGGTELQ